MKYTKRRLNDSTAHGYRRHAVPAEGVEAAGAVDVRGRVTVRRVESRVVAPGERAEAAAALHHLLVPRPVLYAAIAPRRRRYRHSNAA